MSTIAQLEKLETELQQLREEVARMKSTVKLTSGVDPDEVWVSCKVTATSLGISVSHVKTLLSEAEKRRIAKRHTQLEYGVHYMQKAGTPEWQINIVKFREWYKQPSEVRDQ